MQQQDEAVSTPTRPPQTLALFSLLAGLVSVLLTLGLILCRFMDLSINEGIFVALSMLLACIALICGFLTRAVSRSRGFMPFAGSVAGAGGLALFLTHWHVWTERTIFDIVPGSIFLILVSSAASILAFFSFLIGNRLAASQARTGKAFKVKGALLGGWFLLTLLAGLASYGYIRDIEDHLGLAWALACIGTAFASIVAGVPAKVRRRRIANEFRDKAIENIGFWPAIVLVLVMLVVATLNILNAIPYKRLKVTHQILYRDGVFLGRLYCDSSFYFTSVF